MIFNIGNHFHCSEVDGPKAYEVRCGQRYLSALEGGDMRWWPEHALILIDERTGYLTIESGFGTFCYCWPGYARSESLHSFLYDLHFDYFMGKASKQPWRIVDMDQTLGHLRLEVINDRKFGFITKQQARDLWTELNEAFDGSDPKHFVHQLYQSGDWSARLDYTDPCVMVDHPGIRRFWDEIWKPFAEAVLKPHFIKQHSRAKVAA